MDKDIYYREVELETLDANARLFRFVASDESVDSYGDIVRADGWDLRRYKRNPIILFGHDSSLPVGYSPKTALDGTKLIAEVKMADEGTSDFIDTLVKLMSQKIVRAMSVGFRATVPPVAIRGEDDRISGFEFNGQELLENSIVSVPANPNALALAKSWGARDTTLNRLAHEDAVMQAAKRRMTLLRLAANSRVRSTR